ncbi:LysR family transcriptional regulator [Priestia filamentosa]|uniref:Transcriptional regulator n=1 Tax=Priestia filamentosa TaxID=1402861 RepID=A0A1X7EGX2_9BACI|nr:LysR family transcriptional regulator [Priestia filamentosa]AKO92901.1 transcriptional regulator [Priestia filamentosa]MDT3763026.1 LysR family transcriptional regulator [Priestia filamentosa]OXS69544.1 transcriptional regulator [Priestia filamentosa]SMF33770.1 DNA-binding transcriptional regulator, LysR family [Priestia filamentosa]
MESQDLRIFKCVAEQKSISKAAAILGYVQPNVSGRIKHLEEELDTKLLSRTNRGVTLTDEGVLLLEYTEKILFLMDEVKAKMKEGKGEGSLTIGASQTISAFKIPHFLSDFLKQNKNIKVKVKTDTKQILQEQLLYGEIDGLFFSGDNDENPFEEVYSDREKVVLLSCEGHDKRESSPTLLVNSDPNCIYRKKILQFSQNHHFDKPVLMEFDSLESILQGIANGLGMSIIPADIAHSCLSREVVQFEELSEDVQIQFVVKKGKQRSQSMKKFIQFLQNL